MIIITLLVVMIVGLTLGKYSEVMEQNSLSNSFGSQTEFKILKIIAPAVYHYLVIVAVAPFMCWIAIGLSPQYYYSEVPHCEPAFSAGEAASKYV